MGISFDNAKITTNWCTLKFQTLFCPFFFAPKICRWQYRSIDRHLLLREVTLTFLEQPWNELPRQKSESKICRLHLSSWYNEFKEAAAERFLSNCRKLKETLVVITLLPSASIKESVNYSIRDRIKRSDGTKHWT